MPSRSDRWWTQPPVWVEVFVILNLGFLTFDIYLAHSVNEFRNHAEYLPLLFSASAPPALLIALAFRGRAAWVSKIVGYAIGWAGVLLGLSGVLFHLQSHFFYDRTLRSLTYSAPFAAPLAYTGLGFLLIMNRMVDADSEDWPRWVLFMTLGGFLGNFILSLTDHAQNGFFNRLEWAPVIAGAIGVGFLAVPIIRRVSSGFLALCALVLLLEAGVGAWGFLLHASSNLRGPSIHAFDNFIFGAPPMAPLLFPNLVLLGLIGLWRMATTAA